MPRTFVFAILLFLASAYWSFVPPLVLLTTGWKMDLTHGGKSIDFGGCWIQAAMLMALASAWFLLVGQRWRRPTSENEFRTAAGLCAFFLLAGFTLQRFQADLLPLQHLSANFDGAAWVYLAAGVVFIFFLFVPPENPGWILGAVLVFLLGVTPFTVLSFPFDHGLSDMFITLEAAGRSFLQGHSPYEPQQVLGGGRCCYMPGLWLSYLPAVFLNIDPRFLGAGFSVAFALLVSGGMKSQNRLLGSWFLGLFLLNPWSLLRNEVYLPAYLLTWSAFFWALRRGQGAFAARWYGWGLATHPFHWALLPIWLAWMARHDGFEEALRNLGRALTVAALVILPFLAWDPSGFFQGAILFWVGQRALGVSHFGLVSWLGNWPGLLSALAIFFLGMGAGAVWKGKGALDSLFRWSAAALGLALLCSYHIEHYYYFVPLALILFHEIILAERPAPAA